MYEFVRYILFLFDAEHAHHLTLKLLNIIVKIPGISNFLKKKYRIENQYLSKSIWNIKFPNPVGLAAGLDKNGQYIHALSQLGFGFIEIGTITPRSQPGNPQPRLFRLIQDEAIINRMGFNNDGAEVVINNIRKFKKKYPDNAVILGGNIGKNKDTPNELASLDYIYCFNALYSYVDYFVVNVSSPNTPNLRALQNKEPLLEILTKINGENLKKPRKKPILLKISPDLGKEQLNDIIDIAQTAYIDGIIATNTTIKRDNLSSDSKTVEQMGAGGLSGKPLTERSTEIIQYISSRCDKPIIAVGGIMTSCDAIRKIKAGASLVQIYTGLIYKGPDLIQEIHSKILKERTVEV